MGGYDVVVVGGGSAGCVLAARLSEDPGRQVLLVEAGPDYPTVADLPDDLVSGWSPTMSHDWGFHTEPDPGGSTIPLPRAKVIGGCSSTNATCVLRGPPADYDRWGALGNRGWSFVEVLPFFRKLEHDLDVADEWHGGQGPLPVRRYRREELTPWSRAALDALIDAGHPWVEDLNHPNAVGVGAVPNNTIEGVRMNTALTHLAQARHRPNLTILADTLVDRVMLRGRRACGIRVVSPHAQEQIDADLVVLAAGTFCSPAILLRSGIGPAGELVELGIPVQTDLPGVGANLQEHPSVGCAVPIEPMDGPRYQVLVTWASRLVPAGWPFDMHLVPAFNSLPVPWSPTRAAGWVAVNLMKPKSHGRVWLRSADPATLPRVDAGLLAHPDDLACLVEGLIHARQLLRGGLLADLAAGAELLPGGDVADDEQAIGAFVRAKVFGCDHWVGTCAMGPAPDVGAVVDSRGCVHGVEKLVVADASIMPEIPAANTNVPTVMIAERVAASLTDR